MNLGFLYSYSTVLPVISEHIFNMHLWDCIAGCLRMDVYLQSYRLITEFDLEVSEGNAIQSEYIDCLELREVAINILN
jgi:hypothetical protein